MNIELVTGGAGFIGSNLVRRLLAEGRNVRVLDNFLTGKRSNLADVLGQIELVEGDLRNPVDVARAVEGVRVVYHQAALPSVPRSVKDPLSCHQINVDGTFNLLLAAHRAGVQKFIYAASSSAYGDTVENIKHEKISPDPLSPYAAAKLTGEYYCRVFNRCYGLQTICLRYFNVFGPYQDPTSDYAAAIPAFVSAMLRGQQPAIFGDGEQSRDFTYVDNVVEANLLAAAAPRLDGQIVNVACGSSITVNQVVKEIQSLLGVDVQPKHLPPRPGDVRHSRADISLAREIIGYQPKIDFVTGLKLSIEWYRKNLA